MFYAHEVKRQPENRRLFFVLALVVSYRHGNERSISSAASGTSATRTKICGINFTRGTGMFFRAKVDPKIMNSQVLKQRRVHTAVCVSEKGNLLLSGQETATVVSLVVLRVEARLTSCLLLCVARQRLQRCLSFSPDFSHC